MATNIADLKAKQCNANYVWDFVLMLNWICSTDSCTQRHGGFLRWSPIQERGDTVKCVAFSFILTAFKWKLIKHTKIYWGIKKCLLLQLYKSISVEFPFKVSIHNKLWSQTGRWMKSHVDWGGTYGCISSCMIVKHSLLYNTTSHGQPPHVEYGVGRTHRWKNTHRWDLGNVSCGWPDCKRAETHQDYVQTAPSQFLPRKNLNIELDHLWDGHRQTGGGGGGRGGENGLGHWNSGQKWFYYPDFPNLDWGVSRSDPSSVWRRPSSTSSRGGFMPLTPAICPPANMSWVWGSALCWTEVGRALESSDLD